MKIKVKIPLLIVAAFAWIIVISSCANLGMPTGGPQDSIPPILIETHPEYKALNYKGKDVRLTFDEFINTADISEELVISPPLEKRPIIRTKSKSLVIEFNEKLLDSTTYSLDFKNSIADNNEKNPYKNMRFSFSTGNVYDSLRIAGRVLNAFNLEPVEKSLVLLQKNLNDSAVFTVRPNYIAKTDETGLYMIDNIAPGKYNLFSINDLNNDLKYNEGAEEIAFVDSVILPSSFFVEDLDTLVNGLDSFLIQGHTHFLPDPIYLRQFPEDIFDQYLDSYKRETRYKCSFSFNESVEDTFNVNLVGVKASGWYKMEYNEDVDSLVLWITDTITANLDTLFMEVSYYQLDSTKQLYVQKDTLEMNFKDKVEPTKKRKKGKDELEDLPEPIEQFSWETTVRSTTIEMNQDFGLISPEPVSTFDSTKILLYLTEDTLKTSLHYTFERDTTAWRKYKIAYAWEYDTKYTLEIDSAACVNIYGITSKKMVKKFATREEDYYGSRELILTGVKMPMLIQLLKNDDNEDVIVEKQIAEDGNVLFDFLQPGKYKIKVIYDQNGNGKWDSGSFQDKVQPEKVSYINEVIKVKSNWDEKNPWDLKPDLTYTKKIRDIELEEKMRKEAEEKARKELENERESPQEMQNMLQGGGGF